MRRRVRPSLRARRGAPLSSWVLRQVEARWPGVARRQVTFFVSPKKVTKERRPRHTRNPEDQARRVGGKELAPPSMFCVDFCGRGSNTFAADPPATLDLRRVCKGRKVKTRMAMTGRFEKLCATCLFGTSTRHNPHLKVDIQRRPIRYMTRTKASKTYKA